MPPHPLSGCTVSPLRLRAQSHFQKPCHGAPQSMPPPHFYNAFYAPARDRLFCKVEGDLELYTCAVTSIMFRQGGKPCLFLYTCRKFSRQDMISPDTGGKMPREIKLSCICKVRIVCTSIGSQSIPARRDISARQDIPAVWELAEHL